MFIGYLEKCLIGALDFCFCLRLSANYETLGFFRFIRLIRLIVVSFDTFGYSTCNCLTFMLLIKKNPKFYCRASCHLMLSINLFSAYMDLICYYEELNLCFAMYTPLISMDPFHDNLLWVKIWGFGFWESRSVGLREYVWKVVLKMKLFENLKS